MSEVEIKEKVKYQVLYFLKEYLGIDWSYDDNKSFFESEKIEVRDIVWLFVWIVRENNLVIKRLKYFNNDVSVRGFAEYFYEVLKDENCCCDR